MKYIRIYESDTLADLSERVGSLNVDQVLADNDLVRSPKIGKQWKAKCEATYAAEQPVTSQRKQTILNQYVDTFDIYQAAALAGINNWKMLSARNTFSDYLIISEPIENAIPNSYNVLGTKQPVPSNIYNAVNHLLDLDLPINPDIFSTYSTIQNSGILGEGTSAGSALNPMSWFNLPLDKVILYSSIDDGFIGIPAYPEDGISDSRSANYTQMPDLLYQYEPWQMYQSSGPRSCVYEFHLHRDMWTGNHLDGKANELIRFCQAQCYPKYNGAAVIAPTVTLYVNGLSLISGIMTQADVDWKGPLGLDGWYLEFTLRLAITEVSQDILNYASVLSKPLIG